MLWNLRMSLLALFPDGAAELLCSQPCADTDCPFLCGWRPRTPHLGSYFFPKITKNVNEKMFLFLPWNPTCVWAVPVCFQRLRLWQVLAGDERTRESDRKALPSHPPHLTAGTEVFPCNFVYESFTSASLTSLTWDCPQIYVQTPSEIWGFVHKQKHLSHPSQLQQHPCPLPSPWPAGAVLGARWTWAALITSMYFACCRSPCADPILVCLSILFVY